MSSYELRLTTRALADLDLEESLGELPADAYVERHDVVREFVQMRGTNPLGQETTNLPVTSVIVYNLHVGRWRALTWFDKKRGVVWLLGAGWHTSGSRDDAYAVLKARDAAGTLLPDQRDFRNLVPNARSFAHALLHEAPRLLDQAIASQSQEVRATIGGVLGVSVLFHHVVVEDEILYETFISFHLPPERAGVLPDGWELDALVAFLPDHAGPDDFEFVAQFPREGPPPDGVEYELVYSYTDGARHRGLS